MVRREGLGETMSRYLVDQIAKTPNIRLRPRTELASVEGDGPRRARDAALSGGWIVPDRGDRRRVHLHRHAPAQRLASAGVLRDAKGFVLTGRELMAARRMPRTWKEPREPLPLETSVPGVFAAGDVRAGAMNRVASAVGEGSMVVRLAHEYLALT